MVLLVLLVVVVGVDLACLVRARQEAAEVQRRHLFKGYDVRIRCLGDGGIGEGVRLSVLVEDDSVGEFGHACGDGVIFCCRCWSGLLLGGGGCCSGLLLLLVDEEVFLCV